MAQAQVLDFGGHRKRIVDAAREEGRILGKRQAADEYARQVEVRHTARVRIHARWLGVGSAISALLIGLLVANLLPQLHGILLFGIGGALVFTFVHVYYWDRHFNAD